jgi:uncharacterized flavoprotein (TIGR03862 family)
MNVAIIGGGPAGLMAAETARGGGVEVDLYDAMPSIGRKLLLAGKGGLNLTHSEPLEPFLSRYGPRRTQIEPVIKDFGPEALRAWAQALGIKTFVGSSGRVFPQDLKAAPLLRTWLRRLRKAGVRFHVRHRWIGWNQEGALLFRTFEDESRPVHADATILALGGGSWPKLGSDARWVDILQKRGVSIAPLRPANCGFDVEWSDHIRTKFAGHPVKSVAVIVAKPSGSFWQQGEFVITKTGVEGGVIYAVSAYLRDQIEAEGSAILKLDLAPDRDQARLTRELSRPRGKRTMATHLQRRAHIAGVKAALLREVIPKEDFADPIRLAAAIKSLPVKLVAARPMAEAISTAGGVRFEELDERLMIRKLPGLFCAGEMLDWEAPTGGYLLTACFATGRTAGAGAVTWLGRTEHPQGSLL